MGSCLLSPAPTSPPPSSLKHALLGFVKLKKKKTRKNVLQITLHKIQQTVHCNLTWNRSRERGRLARLCINNQCSVIFKNTVSQGCIQDDRQPFLRMWSRLPRELWNRVLKTWMLREKKGFPNTGTRTAVWGLWEESLPHGIVGCTSYLWATNNRPSNQVHLMLWCLVPAQRCEIDIQARIGASSPQWNFL